MINDITYSLEDVETTYHPDRPSRPVICDDCRDAMDYAPNKRINWANFHALKNSPYHYEVVDYYGAGTHGCCCCQSRRRGGRWVVDRFRKAARSTMAA
jgi:hypothetical protein